MGNIGPCVRDVPVRLGEDALVVVAVEKSVLCVLAAFAIPASRPGGDAIDLEASRLKDDDEPAR